MNNKIDVIIPAYNVPDKILVQCLSSIMTQTIIDDLVITIVDDASTQENYLQIVNDFSHYMNIQLLRYEENRGPGYARQYGLDHTFNELITFIDADDMYCNRDSLFCLRDAMQQNNINFVSGVFLEDCHDENNNNIILSHYDDVVWVFAKLYKRSVINKYNIHFPPNSRANEDCGFNLMYVSLCGDRLAIGNPIYQWQGYFDSITRSAANNYKYSTNYSGCTAGYVTNYVYAIKHILQYRPLDRELLERIVEGMCVLYVGYIEELVENPDSNESNLPWIMIYFNDLYAKYEDKITFDILAEKYCQVLKDHYHKNSLNPIIPHITFYQFIQLLRNYEESK